MERKLITEEYISSSEVCHIIDDIEKCQKSGELRCNPSVREDIAKRIILAEKEQIRYALIFDYGLEYGLPEIIDLVDREILISAYIADGKHEPVDTVEGLNLSLIDEPHKVCQWMESVSADILDDYKRFKDPVDYDRKAKEEAIWDE